MFTFLTLLYAANSMLNTDKYNFWNNARITIEFTFWYLDLFFYYKYLYSVLTNKADEQFNFSFVMMVIFLQTNSLLY